MKKAYFGIGPTNILFNTNRLNIQFHAFTGSS